MCFSQPYVLVTHWKLAFVTRACADKPKIVGSNPARANFLYGIEKPLAQNEYHICRQIPLHTHD